MYDVIALRRALKRLPKGTAVRMNIFGKLSVYNKDTTYRGFIDPNTGVFHIGYQPMSKQTKRYFKLGVAFAVTLLAAGLIQGCSFGVYSGEKTTMVGVELGTRSAFEGLVHTRTADTFDLTIQSRQTDSAAGLSAIVEGVVRGVKP